MPGTLLKGYRLARSSGIQQSYLHIDNLLMAGLLVTALIASVVAHNFDSTALRASAFNDIPAASSSGDKSSSQQDSNTAVGTHLEVPMRAALDHIARRYRVSENALVPIFETALEAGRTYGIDPMLLIAVISIESRFNPYSQSTAGAQGLMQIIPRYYQDKVPAGSGKNPFLNPVINVRVGAQILQETIHREGGLMAGLQVYGGSASDERQTYANKVMAEKRLLDQISHRLAKVG